MHRRETSGASQTQKKEICSGAASDHEKGSPRETVGMEAREKGRRRSQPATGKRNCVRPHRKPPMRKPPQAKQVRTHASFYRRIALCEVLSPGKALVLDQVTPERRRQDVSETTVAGMRKEKLHHGAARQMQQVGNLAETVNAKPTESGPTRFDVFC